jgi:preprotein translocase subunit YajC
MQRTFKKNLIALSVIVFLLFVIAFWFLHKEIQQKNTKAEQVLSEWQKEDARRNEIKTILRSVDSIQMNNQIISTHFANSKNLVPFLDTIDSFAPKVGAEDEITSVDILPDTNKLVVSVRVMGSFEAVYKFLNLLENSPYEVKFLAADIHEAVSQQKNGLSGIKSEKTGKVYAWEGLFKLELLSFVL